MLGCYILIQENRFISFLRDFSKKQRIVISILGFIILFSVFFGACFLLPNLKISKLKLNQQDLLKQNLDLSEGFTNFLSANKDNKNLNNDIANQFSYSTKNYLNLLLRQVNKHGLSCGKIDKENKFTSNSKTSKKYFVLFSNGSFEKQFSFFKFLNTSTFPIKIRNVEVETNDSGDIEFKLNFRLI
jgi:hypothetical protein